MNVQVSVRTADGVPIVGATVVLDGGSAVTTDASGGVALAPSADSFTLTASMANYSDQATTIAVAKTGGLSWDDPGTIVTGSGGQLNVEIRLGRLETAPTVGVDAKTLDTQIMRIPQSVFGKFSPPKNPAYTVPLQHTFTMTDAQGQYMKISPGKKRFWAATGPTILGDQSAKGWAALAASSSTIEPTMQGKFTWLEWAPPGGSPSNMDRYLVGLWRPRSSVAPGTQPRDAIVFYTPNTTFNATDGPYYPTDVSPYRKSYPYALNQTEEFNQNLEQRYVELGLNYLFNTKFFSYQLLAAARDALLIVPIQPAANWAVFERPEGIQRLLTEAILFEHRQRLAPDATEALDIAPVPPLYHLSSGGTPMTSHLPPPALGTVITAGFSRGLEPISQLMMGCIRYKPGSTRTWQDEIDAPDSSYTSRPDRFIGSWLEIWDIDGSMNVLGSVATWVGQLKTWQKSNGNRIARCYHSQYTGWNASDLSVMSPVTGPPLPGLQNVGANAAERHGPTGSVVWFSNTYLHGNGPPDNWSDNDAPAFWATKDQHQSMPIVCFAHAAALSQLRKR